jgi:hypothetical protein
MLVYTYDLERIPDNWYRRSQKDPWTLADILISTGQQCVSYPDNCPVGGNTGEVVSFSGVNLGDISGGLVNSVEDLQDSNRLDCFISQAIQADVPSFLDNVFNGALLSQATALIPTMLLPVLAPLGSCPPFPGQECYHIWSKLPWCQDRSTETKSSILDGAWVEEEDDG